MMCVLLTYWHILINYTSLYELLNSVKTLRKALAWMCRKASIQNELLSADT